MFDITGVQLYLTMVAWVIGVMTFLLANWVYSRDYSPTLIDIIVIVLAAAFWPVTFSIMLITSGLE